MLLEYRKRLEEYVEDRVRRCLDPHQSQTVDPAWIRGYFEAMKAVLDIASEIEPD